MPIEIRRLRRLSVAIALTICLIALSACEDHDDDKDNQIETDTGVFYAGAAEGKLDVSVGTPMAGYTGRLREYRIFGRFTGGALLRMPDKRETPFADLLFPSIGVHTPPTAKALALMVDQGNGFDYLVLCRIETCYVTDALRRRVEKLVSFELGQDVTDHLILAATHTHAGPGRTWPLPYFGEFSTDTFNDAITERLAASITDVIVTALDKLRPAKIGMSVMHGLDPDNLLFVDRRLVNDDLDLLTNDNPFLVDDNGRLLPDGQPDGPIKDDRLTLIRVDGTDGFPIALAFSFPIHGTVLPNNNLYLSGDIPGMIEHKLSEAIGRPSPMVMFFQSAEGDIVPVTRWEAFQQLEGLAEFAAERIKPVYETTPVSETVEGIGVVGATIRQDRSLLGYDDAPYPYSQFDAESGAALCGMIAPSEPFYCLSRPDEMVPDIWYLGIASGAISWYFCRTFDLCSDDYVTEVLDRYNPDGPPYENPPEFFYQRYNVAKLKGISRRIITNKWDQLAAGPADVFLLSQPGEPLTTYSYQLRGDLLVELTKAGVEGLTYDDLLLIGIAQDSFGYLVPARDWLAGGYEIGINTWGPYWADYVSDNIVSLALELETGVQSVDRHSIIERQDPINYQPPPVASEVVKAVNQPTNGRRFDAFSFTWKGGDPGVDQPVVTLQKLIDDEFEDLEQADGRPISTDGYRLVLFYEDNNQWTVYWELAEDEPRGTYRFIARGVNYDGGEQSIQPPFFTGEPYEIVSDSFKVFGARNLEVRISDIWPNRILIDSLYPSNRPDFNDNTIDHFRVRPDRPTAISYQITVSEYTNRENSFEFSGEMLLASEGPFWIELDRTIPAGNYVVTVTTTDSYGNSGMRELVSEIL